MSYDLALSENGDLVVTAHKDLAGISGPAQIDQRIKVRLKIHRGQWIYDLNATLGSQLYTLAGTPQDRAVAYADAYVREALKDMAEISVEEVLLEPTDHDLTLTVVYQQILTDDDIAIPADQGLQELTVTIPLTVAANE